MDRHSVSVTTMREVFYGVISQGVAPHFFMRENLICSFFGHRDVDITQTLYKNTKAEIMKIIEFGCRTFYFGGFGDFDELCHKIVSEIKEEQPNKNIQRVFCVPQERYLRKNARFFKRENYERVIYIEPSFDGWYKSIYFRNCAMIDESDFIAFYAQERENSGAYKALKYAKRNKNKKIINLYNKT